MVDVAKKHQEKIAVDTLKMNDVAANIMGGMTKEEARKFLRSIGYSDEKIAKLEESVDLTWRRVKVKEDAIVPRDEDRGKIGVVVGLEEVEASGKFTAEQMSMLSKQAFDWLPVRAEDGSYTIVFRDDVLPIGSPQSISEYVDGRLNKIVEGHDYVVDQMHVAFVGNKPFNKDVIEDLYNEYFPYKSDKKHYEDGHVSIGSKNSSGPLTAAQEKRGWKREIVVSLKIPKGSNDAAFKAVKKVAAKHGLKVSRLEKYRDAKTVK